MINVSVLDLHTESDVEQKYIQPLLTLEYPFGLGYSSSDYKTKLSIRKINIDKGNKGKIYYPDYVIILDGFPVFIIEAKKPGEDLEDAIKEARLYATEINSEYPPEFNPCKYIIATNGQQTIASNSDSNRDRIVFTIDDSDISNPDFYSFLEKYRKSTLKDYVVSIKKRIRNDKKFTRPISILGGKSIQNAIVSDNSFGSNLSIEYRYLFNPTNEDERNQIAKNAYVSSKRRLAHVRPISDLIRATRLNNNSTHIQINDTENPTEIIQVLGKNNQSQKNQVFLLIGSVGAGKSTFVDYLKEVALPDDLKKSTFWIHFDLNDAPSSKEYIFDWLLNKGFDVLEEKSNSFDGIDIRSLPILKKIFAKELKDLEKLKDLFSGNETKYNEEL